MTGALEAMLRREAAEARWREVQAKIAAQSLRLPSGISTRTENNTSGATYVIEFMGVVA